MKEANKTTIENLMTQYSSDELTDSFILPEQLDSLDKKKSYNLLKEARNKRLVTMSESTKQFARIMQLKLKFRRILNSDLKESCKVSFEELLQDYLRICGRSLDEFCNDIETDKGLLEEFLHFRKSIDPFLFIRFALHGRNMIKTQEWLSAYEWLKICNLHNNQTIEKTQQQHVHWQLSLQRD